MKTHELIKQLLRMPPDSAIIFQTEGEFTGPTKVIWDGEDVVLWDGDHAYPVETVGNGAKIVPGSEVKSDPPCDFDYALVRPKTILGRKYGVIEQAWDAR